MRSRYCGSTLTVSCTTCTVQLDRLYQECPVEVVPFFSFSFVYFHKIHSGGSQSKMYLIFRARHLALTSVPTKPFFLLSSLPVITGLSPCLTSTRGSLPPCT